MLPEWAGRKSGSAQSPAPERWAPPRMPEDEPARGADGGPEDGFIVLEPEEEPPAETTAEPLPGTDDAEDDLLAEGRPEPARGSRRWLALVAVVSVIAGLAAGYIYLLLTG